MPSPSHCFTWTAFRARTGCHHAAELPLDPESFLHCTPQEKWNALPMGSASVPLGRDQRPAHDGTANGTPTTKALVDLSCDTRLVLQRPLRLDLRVGDVSHG